MTVDPKLKMVVHDDLIELISSNLRLGGSAKVSIFPDGTAIHNNPFTDYSNRISLPDSEQAKIIAHIVMRDILSDGGRHQDRLLGDGANLST